MSRVVRLDAPRVVSVAACPDPEPLPGQVRLRTQLSGISAGTELTQYRGTNPYLERGWDGVQRMFVEAVPATTFPLDTWGYQEVGQVDAVGTGVEVPTVGETVWGAWGHRGSAVIDADAAARRRLPDDVPAALGIFAHIGAVAFNAVLDADVQLGDHVAVFGLGVPGLFAVQLARLRGAIVIAVDRVPRRLALAGDLGADHCIDIRDDDPATAIRRLTGGRGADVSIELTGSYAGLHSAVRATAYNSRVVCSGFLQGEGIGLRLGEEFHHNRIAIVSSQISGIRPDLAHRWSRERMEATVIRLLVRRRVEAEVLISHVVPVERAQEAFALLDDAAPDVMQVVLDFREPPA